jgi:hypothetical protein
MSLFPRTVEHAFNVTVQRSHNAEPQTSFVKKEIWKQAEAQFAAIEAGAAAGLREAKKKLGL